MCRPGERPHYTSKRTGWPMASTAGQCQLPTSRKPPLTRDAIQSATPSVLRRGQSPWAKFGKHVRICRIGRAPSSALASGEQSGCLAGRGAAFRNAAYKVVYSALRCRRRSSPWQPIGSEEARSSSQRVRLPALRHLLCLCSDDGREARNAETLRAAHLRTRRRRLCRLWQWRSRHNAAALLRATRLS